MNRKPMSKGTLIALSMLAWMLLALAPSAAQQPDIRLPLDPVNYALPFEARIQSVARVGDRTLAVWGTTTPGPDDSVVNQLRMQVMGGTNLVGPQQSLHSADARPYGVVSVLGLRGGFLVLWNDRRTGAPGIYMRRVDTNGTFLGDESRFTPGALQSDSTVQLVEGTGSYAIVWSELRGDSMKTYARRLQTDGQSLGDVYYIGPGSIRQTLRFDSLPGITIVDRTIGFPNVILRDSQLVIRPMPIGLNNPYYIGGDSSIAVLVGYRLVRFRSIFDSTRSNQIPVRTFPNWGLSSVVRDTSRTGYSIIYPVLDYSQLGGPAYLRLVVFKMSLADTTTPAVPIDTVYSWFGDRLETWQRSSSSYRIRNCNNSIAIGFDYVTETYLPTSGMAHQFANSHFSYIVSGDGAYSHVAVSTATPPFRGCDDRAPVLFTRTAYDSISSIKVGFDTALVTLSAPSYGSPVNVAQFKPNVVVQADTVLVTWLSDHLVFNGIDYPGSAGLGVWRSPMHQITLQKSLVFPVAASNSKMVDVSAHGYYEGDILTGASIDRTISKYAELYPGPVTGWLFDDYEWFYVARPRGWVTSRTLYDLIGGVSPRASVRPSRIFFYADRESGTSIFKTDLPVPMIVFVGIHDTVETTMPFSIPDSSIVDFVGTSKLLVTVATVNQLITVAYGAPYMTVQLPKLTGADKMYYRRLIGPYVIRGYSIPGADRRYAQLITLTGDSLRTIEFPVTEATERPAVVQNPTDSSIAFLFAGRNGVAMTYCDKYLNVRYDTVSHQELSTVQLSQTSDSVSNVSGAFRGDTLRVVWEDYRNGNADIYANWWVVPKTLRPPVSNRDTVTTPTTGDTVITPPVTTIQHDSTGAPIPGNNDVAITGLYPNPTHSYITVKFTTRTQGVVSMEVVDMLGRRVGQLAGGTLSSGRYQWGVDCSGLAPGAYMVILHSAFGSDQRRVIVEPF